jgi:hypothetical protein
VEWIEAQLDADSQETMVETRLADNPAPHLSAIETMYATPISGRSMRMRGTYTTLFRHGARSKVKPNGQALCQRL